MDPAWIALAQELARAANAAFFFKQLGNALARERGLPGKGTEPAIWPAQWRVRQQPQRLTTVEIFAREGLRARASASEKDLAACLRDFRRIGTSIDALSSDGASRPP
jgi:hypothetical protein